MKINTKQLAQPQVSRPQHQPHTGDLGMLQFDASKYAGLGDPTELVTLGGKYQEPLAVCCFGLHGAGKSRLAATAPGPIGVVALDRKTRQTMLQVSKQYNKKIIMPKNDLIRQAQPLLIANLKPDCEQPVEVNYMQQTPPVCCAIHYYRWHTDRVKAAIFTMAELPDELCRTIVIDSGTQLWEDIQFANYGRSLRIMPRDRGAANQEIVDILNSIKHKNVIITAKAKDIWKGEGANAKPTGRFKPAGFGDIGYHVNAIVEMRRDPEGEFWLDVKMCQANPSLHGKEGKDLLKGEGITFANLAVRVYEESDLEDWE